MDQYAVFGNPIEHSLSPRIHQLFAEQTQQLITYRKILSPLDGFESSVRAFMCVGGKGANVTLPFKVLACQLCDELSDDARQAGAVNTLSFYADGKIEGHNTDGLGLVRDIQDNHAQSLKGKRLLIIGAGGAVRGIIPALLAAEVSSLDITNRTITKAQQLAEQFTQLGNVTATHVSQIEKNMYDIVIHATSVRDQALLELPVDLLNPHAFFYDLNYCRGGFTPFLQWVMAHNCERFADGLGMLIEQAAEAFYIWRGLYPKTDWIRSELA